MITDEQFKNLKPGDTLVLEITVAEIALGRIYYNGTNCMDCCYPDEVSLPPKHDPCHLFRKGDIVEPCQVNGRWVSPAWEDRAGIRYEVAKDEDPLTAHMEVKDPDSPQPFLVHAAFFKLVTPVEELEPYFVGESENSYDLFRKTSNGNQLRASFWWKHNPTPDLIELSKANAKAAAEAERDRLNAEWRKEQK